MPELGKTSASNCSMLKEDSSTDLLLITLRSLTATRKPRCLKFDVTPCWLKVFSPTCRSFSGNKETVAVKWSFLPISQASCDRASKVSRSVSRLTGGRFSTGVRTKRNSNDWKNFNLSLIMGPLNVTRGVNAAIPAKDPPRRRNLGKKLVAFAWNLSDPDLVCTEMTALVNSPYSAA